MINEASASTSKSTEDTPTSPFKADKDEAEAEEGEETTAESSKKSDDDDEQPEAGEESTATSATPAASDSAGQVTREEASAYAQEAGGLLFFEASAKTGKGVQEIFTEIAKNLPMDSIAPKNAAAGAAGTGPASRRAAGAAGANGGQNGDRVNLNDQGQRARGGCC